jgi:hypothetical protein
MTFMKFTRFAVLLAGISACLVSPVCAQKQDVDVTAAMASSESFMAALRGKDWECSFNSYPRLRFAGETIELLAQDGKISSTLKSVSVLEPGIIKVDYSSGAMVLFIFSEDMKSFVIANMKNMSEFEVKDGTAPVKLPNSAEAVPVEVTFKDNPYWGGASVHASRVEIKDPEGKVFATNEGFAYYPHVLGLKLPEKGAGVVVFSRKRPGGWYLGGRHLGAGARTDFAGLFRTSLRSRMRDFALRSAHFPRALLRIGHEQAAFAQEQYALYNAENVYGENSEQSIFSMNEMGKLRGFALSFDGAAAWHGRAYAAAKEHFAQDSTKLFELGTDYGDSLGDQGNFEESKKILAEVQPHVPTGGNLRIPFNYYKALGAAEFGLRNYAQAAEIFAANQQRAVEGKMEGNEVESILDQAACFMALNRPVEAATKVSLAATRQEEVIKQYPRITFDTYKLSMACSVVQKWPEAQQFSNVPRRNGSVTYMECARLLSLICQGDKAGAQKMAQDFTKRYGGDMEDIEIRRDIDAMIVSMTRAAAEQNAPAIADLEKAWAQQVESLRKRPLQNYIFARVMVASIASLKK